MFDSFVEVEPLVWDEEELEFAQSLTETFSAGQKAAMLRGLNIPGLRNQFLHQSVFPLTGRHDTLPGSTDVSDVSWITPTTGVAACCQAIGTSGHSWQVTAASGMSIGHKGMLYAAKALALAGSKLVRNRELIEMARLELNEKTTEKKYKCVVPQDIAPHLD
jgi:aminobenzoyl-glutamate utilization protein B